MQVENVVVVGAGVAAAKHMPGDYDIEYASPWAGASFMPVSLKGTEAAQRDKDTWPFLAGLAKNNPGAGIHFQECNIYNRGKDAGSATSDWFAELTSENPWWKSLFPDFSKISKSELGPGIDSGSRFTSVCINTAIYLPWLASQCLENGVVFKRASFSHINDAALMGVHHTGTFADVVVNCTGLASKRLGGVEDERMYPARAQVVLVRNDANAIYSVSGTDDAPDETMYIMTRAAGGGTILGGCYQRDNWDPQPDPNLALRIMKRCVDACPQLSQGRGFESLDVIRHGVGLRPARDGGARVEKETINGIWTVHNYGHGGAGYQCSYGCALAAVSLVDQISKERGRL